MCNKKLKCEGVLIRPLGVDIPGSQRGNMYEDLEEITFVPGKVKIGYQLYFVSTTFLFTFVYTHICTHTQTHTHTHQHTQHTHTHTSLVALSVAQCGP